MHIFRQNEEALEKNAVHVRAQRGDVHTTFFALVFHGVCAKKNQGDFTLKKSAIIATIAFAVALLAAATPLAMAAQAASGSNSGSVLFGMEDTTWTEADNERGTIDSISQQAASDSGQGKDYLYAASAATIVQTINLSNLAGEYPGVKWNGKDLTFDPTCNAYYYEIIQTNAAVAFVGKIIFLSGTDSTVTINGINTKNSIELQGGASLKLLLAGVNATGGILVPKGTTIIIDSAADGKLTANGGDYAAGIGGYMGACGTIIINGGTVTARGGDYGAGIGGGYNGAGGEIIITSGTVTAIGSDWYGAGIGGGYNGAGGYITIKNGTVTSTGGVNGAGIGGGDNGGGGNITIENGTVTATGTSGGAGIGGGKTGASGYITIGSGNVTATGGNSGGAGIGTSYLGSNGTLRIDFFADIKAYSRGVPAIVGDESGNSNRGYRVNASFADQISNSAVMIRAYADGDDTTVLKTLVLPGRYTGFEFSTGEKSVTTGYNLFATISDVTYQIILTKGETDRMQSVNNGSTLQIMLKSNTAVTGVTLNTNSVILGVGEKERITATVFPSDATIKNVKWLSSNESVATVDENGVVTAVGVGQITISVTTGDKGYRAFCTVKVLAEVTHTTGVVLDKESLTLPIYHIEQITKTIYPSDAAIKNVKWSSSNRTVASVDAAGKVIGITPGTAVITVTTADGGFTATCVVTVVAPVKSVSVDKSSLTLKEGHSEEITATVSPASATSKDVTWSSSDESVASVVDGFVTAIRKGTATITARTVEGDFEAFCLLVVEGQQVIVT